MFTRFLVILLILDSIVLVAAILLQSGKGGGMAASFGGASSSADALLGTRQAGNLLTKASWWAGGIFIFLAFVLQVASSRGRTPTSVLDKAVAVPAAAPTAPATSGNAAQSVVPLQSAPAPAATPVPAPAAKP
jgi:preprotein translocase subunit SecG